MLGQLHIKNIGIIDEITLNFEEGLNILTGETGAGKSLIIDSISAITGSRMSKEIIKHGESMALVEACFFQGEETKILTREFYKNGRSVCKIDGRMVTLGELKKVGENLIDIHGQHDNQSLLDEKTHIELLDKFSGEELKKLKNEYFIEYERYNEIKEKIKQSFGDPTSRARRIDLLKYQKEEIEDAALKDGEEEDLNNSRNLILNSEKIAKGLNKSYLILNECIIEKLENLTYELSNISNFDKKYEEILQTVNDSYYSLKDIESELSDCLDDVNFDEAKQDEIEERLNLIHSLKRKYGSSIEQITHYLEEVKTELDFLENSEEIVNKLKIELSQKEEKLFTIATKMTDIRNKAAKEIEIKVNEQLQDLEMKKAYIKFEFQKSEILLNNGIDLVQIMICTNMGEGTKPLSKIASGGEVSRVMLALKTILCMYDNIPTMIFDEIDTGISGQAGRAVGEKMKIIGKTHQVITVTHLPVIAAAGDANYFIEKYTKDDRTITRVTQLDEEKTIKEIARISAGNNISSAVLEHSKEMRQYMKGKTY